MIIVSQDKSVILNFNNTISMELEDFIKNSDGERKKVIKSISGEGECYLGYYETEERAKEVLQEIVKKYASYLQLNGEPALVQGQMDVQPNIFNIPKVYKMPEE